MVFGPTCERCDGAKKDAQGDPCALCEGRGDRWIYRCPASQLEPDAADLLRMWGPYQNGVCPDSGGLYDQAACFVHAMAVLATEKAAIERVEQPKTPPKGKR